MPRASKQRTAILDALARAGRPLSPEEVLADARRSAPRLGVATVYRAIKTLLVSGSIAPVSLPGEAARYELSGKSHHHHFICRACERVFDLDGCPVPSRPSVPAGFQVEGHEVFVVGRCASCAKSRQRRSEGSHH